MTSEDIHAAAVAAGATVLGDPHHYLMDADQLAAFLERFDFVADAPAKIVLPPPY